MFAVSFGFLDGISQPAVQGFDTKPNPGQETIPQGIMLLGRDGDTVAQRPKWAVDGSLSVSFLYTTIYRGLTSFIASHFVTFPSWCPSSTSS